MKHARLAFSPRLQRLLKVLREAEGELSTMDLIARAGLAAPSTAVGELRRNGCEISCRCEAQPDGSRRYFYQLRKGPSNDQ